MSTIRAANMERRRQRILAVARATLARGGFEALTLRSLAQEAGVTVPTIYNLIGNKEEVLLALADEVLAEIEARFPNKDEADPLDAAAAVVTGCTQIFSENANYYRAAFLALENLDQSGQHHDQVERVYVWAETLMHRGIDACLSAGLLRGRVAREQMSRLMTRSFRMNCRAWAFGYRTITQFHEQALADLYLILAADAVETFHARLLRNLKKSQSNTSVIAKTNRSL